MLPPIAALKLDGRSTGNSQLDVLLPLSVNTRVGHVRRGADSAAAPLDVRGVGGRKVPVASTANADGASPITRTGRKLLLALTDSDALGGVSYATSTASTGNIGIGTTTQQQKAKKQRVSGAAQTTSQPKTGVSSAVNAAYMDADTDPKDKTRAADRLPIIQKSLNALDQV